MSNLFEIVWAILTDETGQADAEYALMMLCLLGAVIGLKILNLVINKAYLDAMNGIRQW